MRKVGGGAPALQYLRCPRAYRFPALWRQPADLPSDKSRGPASIMREQAGERCRAGNFGKKPPSAPAVDPASMQRTSPAPNTKRKADINGVSSVCLPLFECQLCAQLPSMRAVATTLPVWPFGKKWLKQRASTQGKIVVVVVVRRARARLWREARSIRDGAPEFHDVTLRVLL